MVCIVLMVLPGRQAYGSAIRAAIRKLFGAWVAWLHATRIVAVEWIGFGEGALQPGTVYIANHPTIVDAPLILARLPDAICIFKPALMSNPAVGPAAAMAGYVRGDTGLDLIKAVAEKVALGQSPSIFPEGTPNGGGTTLGRMKPGFALIMDMGRWALVVASLFLNACWPASARGAGPGGRPRRSFPEQSGNPWTGRGPTTRSGPPRSRPGPSRLESSR